MLHHQPSLGTSVTNHNSCTSIIFITYLPCKCNVCLYYALCRSVLGSVVEGGATSTPGSFSDIMQSPMSSSKPPPADMAGECITSFLYSVPIACTQRFTVDKCA